MITPVIAQVLLHVVSNLKEISGTNFHTRITRGMALFPYNTHYSASVATLASTNCSLDLSSEDGLDNFHVI